MSLVAYSGMKLVSPRLLVEGSPAITPRLESFTVNVTQIVSDEFQGAVSEVFMRFILKNPKWIKLECPFNREQVELLVDRLPDLRSIGCSCREGQEFVRRRGLKVRLFNKEIVRCKKQKTVVWR